MNTELIIRYAAELAMLIPAAVIAIMPVYRAKRIKALPLICLMSAMLLAVIAVGAVICAATGISSNTVIFPSMLLFFLAYHLCFELSMPKKVFCFANAVFLCGFATTYNTFLTAPLELNNPYKVYTLASGLICLGIAFVVGAVFARALLVKFPELLNSEVLDFAWKWLMFAPIVTAAAVVWMNPVSAENVMTGRLRPICLVVLLSIPLVALFMYHVFWWLTKNLTETAKLQQSIDIFKMEEKQYELTQRYLQETSQLRHDFKHHLHVIWDLAEKGQTEEQLAYMKPLIDVVEKPVKYICDNQPLNAICSYYYYKAAENGITILWGIDVGRDVHISETELCGVVGNLLSNAMKAVSELDEDERTIDLRIGTLAGKTLVISIKNPYKGTLNIGKNGLPLTDKKDHGIGLRSVVNTVERYGGSVEFDTHDHVFNVSIMMYAPD